MDYEIIINKNKCIKNEELPKKLVAIGKNEHPTISFENETDDILLEETAALFFIKMMNDFNSSHINKLIPDSGYRTIERQKRLLKYYYDRDGEEAFSYVAPPRSSEHHTGLAIDIALIINGKYTDDITGEEEEIIDLQSICYKYGYILRYPKGKEEITGYKYEPWHFRFVGLNLAKRIHESGLTLEEIKQLKYVKKLK
ncbi:M15 family metallopeptidase [Candidatus Saccharibacteria bacterium]|nr:M15 family metallopeptidase [Candidatus Saccharibacteria bacterium]